MYTIDIYNEAKSVNIRSAGSIGTVEQIIDFLGNHTDMTHEDREDFALEVHDHLATNEETDIFTGPALKDGQSVHITVTWEG